MRRRGQRRSGFDIAEFLGTDTSGRKFSLWVYGIVSSSAIALYGLSCVATQTAKFIGHLLPVRIVEYNGSRAVALGLSYFAAAVFLHCHFCWADHEKYYGYAAIGKVVSLVGAVAGLIFLVFDVIFS